MIMNVIVIGLVLGLAYAWTVRGAFNAMIHALCVFIGGAVAFALWEPVSNLLLSFAPERGLLSALVGAAWGLGLIVPFLITTAVLRIITDKVVTANVNNSTAVDYAGGAVFGLVASVLGAGVLVIGIGHMRLPTNFLGYQPVWYHEDRNGYLVDNAALWIPVDRVAATVYSTVSEGSMGSSESLAKWYPDVALTGFASRISPDDGAGQNAAVEDAFEPLSWYRVGNENGSTDKQDIIPDEDYRAIDGEPFSRAAYLAGFVVEFGPKAKESGDKGGGQVVVSNGQVRLLTRDKETGKTGTVFPLATISESTTNDRYGRWVYDAKDVFVTSTGGKSRIEMGFEFLVPADEEPLALYVRQQRVPLSAFGEAKQFANASARDTLVASGAILKGGQVEREFNDSNAADINIEQLERKDLMVYVTPSIGTVLSSQIAKQRGLSVSDDNEITSGEALFDKPEHGRGTVSGKNLRVENFLYGDAQSMVQIKVGNGSDGVDAIPGGLLSEAAKNVPVDEPFLLIDTNGNEYEAVGYIYEANGQYSLRYTPGSTLSGISDAPPVSSSRTDQDLKILFLTSRRIQVDRFAVGSNVLMKFDPPIVIGN